jgi:hypothetical protein
VISLIKSEAEKQRTARDTAIPGQHVPATMSSPSAAAMTSAKPEIGLVAPAIAPANVTAAPAKLTAWGATPPHGRRPLRRRSPHRKLSTGRYS